MCEMLKKRQVAHIPRAESREREKLVILLSLWPSLVGSTVVRRVSNGINE